MDERLSKPRTPFCLSDILARMFCAAVTIFCCRYMKVLVNE